VEKYEEIIAASDDTLQRDPQFLAMTESLDINVGKVIDALEEKGLTENTFVIFVSDNGGLNVEREIMFLVRTIARYGVEKPRCTKADCAFPPFLNGRGKFLPDRPPTN
jgi:arylsulfatase A-like enzyme